MISFRRAFLLLTCTVAATLGTSCSSDAPTNPTAATSSTATRSPTADPRLPEGTYRTTVLTVDQPIAAGVAAGFERADVERFWHVVYGVKRTIALTIKVQSGRWTQFGAVDGGPDEIGWTGTFQVVDDDTIIATGGPCHETYDFKVDGDELHVAVVSCECAGARAPDEEWIAQTTIYQTAPFTRVG